MTEGYHQEWSLRLNWTRHGELTRSSHSKDQHIDSSFLILWSLDLRNEDFVLWFLVYGSSVFELWSLDFGFL